MRLRADSDQAICAGTVEALDRHIELILEAIGEPVPGNSRVEYVMTDDVSLCRFVDDARGCIRWANGVRPNTIISSHVPHSHELAHAVHSLVWPRSRGFLQEGFAELFGDWSRNPVWYDTDDLDTLFAAGAGRIDNSQYHPAWIFTSRLVREHGFDGLRDFWHAVPPTPSIADVHASSWRPFWNMDPRATSAADVHAAYRDVFGSEATELITPPSEDDEVVGCVWVLCEEPIPWDGDLWRLEPPMSDCENDPDAVGPVHVNSNRIARFGTVELAPGTYEMSVESDGVAFGTPCGHDCTAGLGVLPPYAIGPPPLTEDGTVTLVVTQTEHWKMETVAWLDRSGDALTIHRVDP